MSNEDWRELDESYRSALSGALQTARPAVEQAGANVGHGHVFPRADGVKMRCGGPGLCSECTADASRARAALAQPSPKCSTCGGTGMVDDGEIDCYSDGTPFENGPVKCVKDCPACKAQPSPAQAEQAEWPIVSFEKYMQVMYDRDEHAKRLEVALARVAEFEAQAQHSVPGKYDDVLLPFLKSMEHELHANAGKGDRPGWLQMDRRTALLEIYYHLAKLQKATKDNDAAGIVEYAADVANMSMMLVDVCGLLAAAPGKEGV